VYVNQSIQRPLGVTVFGSTLMRVDPDYASLRFAVTRLAAKPKEAFDEARAGAERVREVVRKLRVADRDVRSSGLSLAEEYVGYNQDRKMAGFRATIDFHAIVRDFAVVEPLLVAVVDAGADRIMSVHSKTSRLRELRKDARARAVAAARAKAEQYAAAAGAKLGAVLHIEDVNPDEMSRRSHMPDVDMAAEEQETEAHNPGAIALAGAVMMSFALLAP
jgi:uncharacterized protein YggE